MTDKDEKRLNGAVFHLTARFARASAAAGWRCTAASGYQKPRTGGAGGQSAARGQAA